MRTLTRDEARARAALVEVASYAVELEVDGGPTFLSTTEVRFSCRRPGAGTFLELDGELLGLERDGREVPAEVHGNRIALDDLAAQEVVRVRARCATTTTGEGLHRAVDPADGEVYLYANTFLDDAQRVFACFDQPDLKARVQLTVTAPERWTVLANTRAVSEGGRHVFAPTERLATYLVTLAAGPWAGERAWHDGIELGVWCRRSLAAALDAEELLGITRACLDVQQELFGRRYPFGDTYDQVFVPDFNAGAMENPGMVTLSDDSLLFRSRVTQERRRGRAQVIAHEMAHMWFGDLVTMRWWDDLWLNESFAELMGVETVERASAAGALPYAGGWAEFCLARKTWGAHADQRPTTHPVAGGVPDNRAALLNFDGISYAKGAAALRQLWAALGEQAFFGGVRAYLARHAWGSTSLADLLTELERASGRDLGEWARLWLGTTGIGVLRLEQGQGGAQVLQEGPVLRPHHLGVGAYADDGDGVLRLRERVEVDVTGARTPVRVADTELVLPNDGDLTYATVRLDERSLATALRRTGDLEDPLARAVVWSALADATRDGELPVADLVGAVLAGVGSERDAELVGALLDQARHAAQAWSRDAPAPLADLHAHALASADAAAPGSDLQLVHARAAVATAPDGRLPRAWRDGQALPQGLVVDTELRWLLVRRLAALGDPAADVAGELARDRSAAGEHHAAWASAAQPDPGAKAAVWSELLGAQPLGNGRARALAAGFWQPGQDDLLRPYAARWAREVRLLWERQGPTLATVVARRLFPSTLPEPEVLAVTDLPREGLPAGLVRVVLEERDELARAVRLRGQ